ncbi:MAG: phage tail tip fiber protein [Bacteroidales bacterium]
MHNSRLNLSREVVKPTNTSKGEGLILETPYKPGFVEDKDLESVKMAVDKELSDVANAFQITTERTADTITRVDELKIEGDGLSARIEQVDKVSKEGDVALAERITKIEAEVGEDIRAALEEEARARADADGALAERITKLQASSEAGDATLTQEMSVVSTNLGKVEAKWGVSMDVNGKVSGVSMNNDGDSSEFNVVADKFRVSDGTTDLAPFEVVGQNTRIKSALVSHIQSDNWDGNNGWAINNKGDAIFRNGQFQGDVRANSGYFRGDLTGSTGTFSGSLNVTDTAGTVGMKITNSQILVYDEHGRLRIKIGRL